MAQTKNSQELTRAVRTAPRQRPRVIILGGGFAGINAAKELGGQAVDVTLIDRRNHHVFQPLLYQVALAVLSPADIAQPIRGILSHFTNVEVLMDEAVGFDLDRQIVFLSSQSQMEYDYLIVATAPPIPILAMIRGRKTLPGSRHSKMLPRSVVASCSLTNLPNARCLKPASIPN